jgi:hypothetical protein
MKNERKKHSEAITDKMLYQLEKFTDERFQV